jgi:predicted metal-dependent HD superfamily phosphohydrolase
MIEKAIEWKWELTDELVYAILYHDFVYDPTAKDNEEKSADEFNRIYESCIFPLRQDIDKECGYAEEFLLQAGEKIPWHEKDVIYAILSTKNHKPLNKLAKQLIDLDLAILAEESIFMDEVENTFPEIMSGYYQQGEWPYMTYLLQVRREFSTATDQQWKEGRSVWIKSMLVKEHIFHTNIGREMCEERARKNLKAELALYE